MAGQVALLLERSGHESGEEGQDHLGISLGNVLGQGVDDGADLASRGDGVLGVGDIVVLRSVDDQVGVVDGTGSDVVNNVSDGA